MTNHSIESIHIEQLADVNGGSSYSEACRTGAYLGGATGMMVGGIVGEIVGGFPTFLLGSGVGGAIGAAAGCLAMVSDVK